MIRVFARAERPARLDELLLAEREREAAHDPGDVRPGEEHDDRDHERAAPAGSSAAETQPCLLELQAATMPIEISSCG